MFTGCVCSSDALHFRTIHPLNHSSWTTPHRGPSRPGAPWLRAASQDLAPSNFRRTSPIGLQQGSLYALVALGYTSVYGVLQLINFAHSEVFHGGLVR